MKRDSTLTFKDLWDSEFGDFIKIVWNGRTIYEDSDELYIEGKQIERTAVAYTQASQDLIARYSPKHIYSFYCRVVNFHHTELYIEGEK